MVVLAAMLMVGCAVDTETVRVIKGADGKDGVSCTLSEVEGGVSLSCSDETSFTIYHGQNGQNGENGNDGLSCSVEQLEGGAEITCGDSSAIVLNGTDGQDGQDGEDGENGSDGGGVTITSYSGNSCTLIAGSSVYVKKGNNNAGLYTSSSCHSRTKYAEVSQGEAYWVSTNMLATWNGSSIKVLTF